MGSRYCAYVSSETLIIVISHVIQTLPDLNHVSMNHTDFAVDILDLLDLALEQKGYYDYCDKVPNSSLLTDDQRDRSGIPIDSKALDWVVKECTSSPYLDHGYQKHQMIPVPGSMSQPGADKLGDTLDLMMQRGMVVVHTQRAFGEYGSPAEKTFLLVVAFDIPGSNARLEFDDLD